MFSCGVWVRDVLIKDDVNEIVDVKVGVVLEVVELIIYFRIQDKKVED